MGFSAILDIVGSAIIGSILLIILFRINDNAANNTYNFSGELVLQENLVTTVEVLEYDFRKIGYCENPNKIPNPSRAILKADTSSITFLTDVNFDGNVDTLEYELGSASELNETPNPNDRMLYRIVNDVKTGVNLGVTYFKIRYFDVLERELTPPLSVPTGIASMEIDIEVQNTSAYGGEYNPVAKKYEKNYRIAFWRQIKLASRNLNNR